MKHIVTQHYARITARKAKARYHAGKKIALIPCNLNPESPWGLLYFPSGNETPWEELIALFKWYNCDTERGKYPAFYMPRIEYEEECLC